LHLAIYFSEKGAYNIHMNNKKTHTKSARKTSIRNRILGADFVNSLDD